jgi:hypothetical protein
MEPELLELYDLSSSWRFHRLLEYWVKHPPTFFTVKEYSKGAKKKLFTLCRNEEGGRITITISHKSNSAPEQSMISAPEAMQGKVEQK